jgi:hypothetical protein
VFSVCMSPRHERDSRPSRHIISHVGVSPRHRSPSCPKRQTPPAVARPTSCCAHPCADAYRGRDDAPELVTTRFRATPIPRHRSNRRVQCLSGTLRPHDIRGVDQSCRFVVFPSGVPGLVRIGLAFYLVTKLMPVTLFVDGVGKNVTSIELQALFQSFHPSRVILASHRSGTPLGFAFVLFANETDASHALAQLQGIMLAGRTLTISRTITPATHSGMER